MYVLSSSRHFLFRVPSCYLAHQLNNSPPRICLSESAHCHPSLCKGRGGVPGGGLRYLAIFIQNGQGLPPDAVHQEELPQSAPWSWRSRGGAGRQCWCTFFEMSPISWPCGQGIRRDSAQDSYGPRRHTSEILAAASCSCISLSYCSEVSHCGCSLDGAAEEGAMDDAASHSTPPMLC